jgi:hypothetical protein
MKTTFWSIAFSTLLAVSMVAQDQGTSPYVVVERGDHHRLWQSVTTVTDARGKLHYRTNSYTELETGMHYQKDGQWLESKEEVELTAQGAIARHGRHQVIFAANCNSPVAIDMLTPDGKRFQSRVLGLAYFDSASGKMAWIAQLKDSVGQVLPPNQVIYIDCFTGQGLKAHLRYTYTKSGFEQDIILRTRPPTPGTFGMNPATTRLQVMTEFLNPPTPKVEARQVDGVTDERLDFGDMAMGSGKAFSLLGDVQNSVPVTKGWGTLDGRVFLTEEASYPLLEPLLRALPASQATLSPPKGKLYAVSTRRQLPPAPVAKKKSPRPMMVASVPLSGQGVVVDYTIMSSTTNHVFPGDSTSYVSGTVNLSGTQTVFEAGCVIKFSPTNTPKLNITSPINWQGSMYRPIAMTARDDHTVGENIGSASVSGYYADPAMYIDATAAGTSAILQNLRIAYASTAIAINGGSSNVVSHAQLAYCANGFAPTNAQFHVRNALFYNVLTNFAGSSSTGRCEHLTVNTANWLNHNSSITLTATNSLLVSVTNTGTYTSSYVSNAVPSIFQTVGAASHYLTTDTFRNLGTASIDASLASDLKKLTTYPPIELTSDFTVDTTLSPQAQRDTDAYDLGWHYTPLDYVVSGRTLTNSTLTLTNGVALGIYGPSSSYGILVRAGANVRSDGLATNLNRIVRYNTAQEQATTNWSATSVAPCVSFYYDVTPVPLGHFRFTDWSLPGGVGYHVYSDFRYDAAPLDFSDCQFGPGSIFPRVSAIALTNCLFERVSVTLDDDGNPRNYYAYNNLFRFGSLSINAFGGGTWQIKDNLFDRASISKSGTITHDYNGYVTNYNRLSPNGANDKILTNSPIYLTSTLGRYYYPTNDGMLSLLLDAGSRNATNAGLYHFTTTTNQVVEGNSQVDIGFHYVATTNGVPTDSDGDGAPDYLEDQNGNGMVDSGETDWQNASDLGLKVLITRPRNGSNLP